MQCIDLMRTECDSRLAMLLYLPSLLSALLPHRLSRLLRSLRGDLSSAQYALSQIVILLRVRQACADDIGAMRARDDEAEAVLDRVAADASAVFHALVHQRPDFIVHGFPGGGCLLFGIVAVDVEA